MKLSIRNKSLFGLAAFLLLTLSLVLFKNTEPSPEDFESQVRAERHQTDPQGKPFYRSFTQFPLNAGLPRVLHQVNGALSFKNKVYVLVHKTELDLDFQSPKKMMHQFQEAGGMPDLGHVQVAWSCNVDGKTYESATGFTGESDGQGFRLAMGGFRGTAALLTYKDGRLEPPWVVQVRTQKTMAEGRMSGIVLPVSEKECQLILSKMLKFRNGKAPQVSDGFRWPEQLPSASGPIRPNGTNCFGFFRWLAEGLESFPEKYFLAARKDMSFSKALLGWGELPEGVEFPLSQEFSKGLDRQGSLSFQVYDAGVWLGHYKSQSFSRELPWLQVATDIPD